MSDAVEVLEETVLCSECFVDEGLRIEALRFGIEQGDACPNCKKTDGKKLDKGRVEWLAQRYFVHATKIRFDYGAAPLVVFNNSHYGSTEIPPPEWLKADMELLEQTLEIGFFHYGPRLWMLGEIEPLKALQDASTRAPIIERVLNEYPTRTLSKDEKFYRLRCLDISTTDPLDKGQYDSPPVPTGSGRLDAIDLPIMYGSQDLDICIHECRSSVEDDIYVATFKVEKDLKLLNLAHVLKEDCTEFESLDLAIHMLFMARKHSYEISRAIAREVRAAGYDGLIYPSYFSLIRTGGEFLETVYGMSTRQIHPQADEYAEQFTIRNLALFGHPLAEGKVSVHSINRLVITQIGYQGHLGFAGKFL